MVKLWAIGGYEQVGMMMTAIKFENDDKWIVIDAGLNMDKLISLEEKVDNPLSLPAKDLYHYGVLPYDLDFFEKHGKDVAAFVISHGHLDHCGAVVKLINKYKNAVLIATPFTIEVIRNLEEYERIKNRIITLYPGVEYRITEKTTLELINITHSIPQTAVIALYNDEGNVIYSVDFKFDDFPILGKKTDYSRLRKAGKDAIVLITDTTRVERLGKSYSEIVVRDMLEDILNWYGSERYALIFSTFSSHIARIYSVIKLAEKIGREPVLVGRSLKNYSDAATRSNVLNLKEMVKIYGTPKKINEFLKKANKERDKYLLIVTGHQGEKDAILTRITFERTKFKLRKEDIVIIASETIPSPVNIANRTLLENELKKKGVRLFTNVHVSGHAYSEDLRSMLKMIKPQYYIPAHGDIKMLASASEIASTLGYIYGKDTLILRNNLEIELKR